MGGFACDASVFVVGGPNRREARVEEWDESRTEGRQLRGIDIRESLVYNLLSYRGAHHDIR